MRSGSQSADDVRAVELEVERVVVGAEQLGEHLRRGVELGVAVLVRLHDRRVHAERHVVHEHAAVDPREVDASFVAVEERVERTHHVVAVDAEVEREVVAGAGGDAHERDVVLGRDARHQGLRAVAAGHADHVGAPRDRVPGELLEVVAARERHRLDAARLGGGGELGVGLPATRPRVHDQDRVLRGADRLAARRSVGDHCGITPQRGARERSECDDGDDGEDDVAEAVVLQEGGERDGDGGHRDHRRGDAHDRRARPPRTTRPSAPRARAPPHRAAAPSCSTAPRSPPPPRPLRTPVPRARRSSDWSGS